MFSEKQFVMNEAGSEGASGGSSNNDNSATNTEPKQDTGSNQNTQNNLAQNNDVGTQQANQDGKQDNGNNQNFNSGLWDGEEQKNENVENQQQQNTENNDQSYSHEEAYKDFEFKIKDGYSLTDEQKQDYLNIAKEQGVKPDQMQTFIDKHIEATERNLGEYKKTVSDWDNEVRNDPVLGGDNFPQTKKNLNNALSGKIDGGQEVRKLLAETGLISNPSVVKFMNNLGKMLVDGKIENGGIADNQSKADYKSIYPNTQYNY
ncbi:MAG: hypothetical protein [Bacteriophage sp.]|nr:MAG: hypothetical protein [Bacteriophage sp.]